MPVPPARTPLSRSSRSAARRSSAASASAKWKSGRSRPTARLHAAGDPDRQVRRCDRPCAHLRGIVKGHNVPQPGVPESFKVLVKELQSLCLDIQVLDRDGNEIELKEDEDADTFNLARRMQTTSAAATRSPTRRSWRTQALNTFPTTRSRPTLPTTMTSIEKRRSTNI